MHRVPVNGVVEGIGLVCWHLLNKTAHVLIPKLGLHLRRLLQPRQRLVLSRIALLIKVLIVGIPEEGGHPRQILRGLANGEHLHLHCFQQLGSGLLLILLLLGSLLLSLLVPLLLKLLTLFPLLLLLFLPLLIPLALLLGFGLVFGFPLRCLLSLAPLFLFFFPFSPLFVDLALFSGPIGNVLLCLPLPILKAVLSVPLPLPLV
mmetsp:Transcript_30941/g.67869  ORF Transcript_30941/g.67869 Transcript_30941/m.67869 type:complete len:204 (+) Transcript_30941:557-1168(+)